MFNVKLKNNTIGENVNEKMLLKDAVYEKEKRLTIFLNILIAQIKLIELFYPIQTMLVTFVLPRGTQNTQYKFICVTNFI